MKIRTGHGAATNLSVARNKISSCATNTASLYADRPALTYFRTVLALMTTFTKCFKIIKAVICTVSVFMVNT